MATSTKQLSPDVGLWSVGENRPNRKIPGVGGHNAPSLCRTSNLAMLTPDLGHAPVQVAELISPRLLPALRWISTLVWARQSRLARCYYPSGLGAKPTHEHGVGQPSTSKTRGGKLPPKSERPAAGMAKSACVQRRERERETMETIGRKEGREDPFRYLLCLVGARGGSYHGRSTVLLEVRSKDGWIMMVGLTADWVLFAPGSSSWTTFPNRAPRRSLPDPA